MVQCRILSDTSRLIGAHVAINGGDARRGLDNGPSDDLLLARQRVYLMIASSLPILAFLVGLGILTLMAVPLAHVIAGKHTDFGLHVSVSVNLVLTATTALGGVGYAVEKREVRRQRDRARRLERRVEELSRKSPGQGTGSEG
jgi:hypothetical protein